MSILLSCDIKPSLSAYSFIKSPISLLLTSVFFENWVKVGTVCLQMFKNFEVTLKITKQFSTPNLSISSMNRCSERNR